MGSFRIRLPVAAKTAFVSAGIQVRMITGDHAVTAAAIGRELGLEGRALTGAEFAAIGDEPAGGTPQDLADTIAKDSAKWKGVVERSGAKLD